MHLTGVGRERVWGGRFPHRSGLPARGRPGAHRASPRAPPGAGGAGRANSARSVLGRGGAPPGGAPKPPGAGACVERYTIGLRLGLGLR